MRVLRANEFVPAIDGINAVYRPRTDASKEVSLAVLGIDDLSGKMAVLVYPATVAASRTKAYIDEVSFIQKTFVGFRRTLLGKILLIPGVSAQEVLLGVK